MKTRTQQNPTISSPPFSLDQGKKPTMAGTRDESPEAAATTDDFEFRILSTGGLLPAGAGDMCVADELFSHGKLLPLRPAPDSPSLPRSESAAAAGLGSRSDSGRRSASSSGSSTGCVSRSHSSKSASSDAVLQGAAAAPRRSLASSLFYAHPSPSPRLLRPRRSTGSSAPPPPPASAAAAWGGFLRLGVVGAPDVYPPRLADAKITAASRGGSGRSARFERAASVVEKSLLRKHSARLFGDGFGCKCSPSVVVEPVGLPEAAKKSGDDGGVKKKGRSVRRMRILDWLEELSITKQKK